MPISPNTVITKTAPAIADQDCGAKSRRATSQQQMFQLLMRDSRMLLVNPESVHYVTVCSNFNQFWLSECPQ